MDDPHIKAGGLRQLVDIEQPGETKAPSGAVVHPPWTLFATVRANVETISGREVFGGEEFISEATDQITIRYLPGITLSMRVNFKTDAQRAAGQNGRLFDILNVNDVNQRHRKMILTCREATRSHGV